MLSLKKIARAWESQRAALRAVQSATGRLAVSFRVLRESVQQQFSVTRAEALKDMNEAVQRFFKDQGTVLAQVRQQYRTELAERKRLFNLVQELRGNIRVLCRCRPPSERELTQEEGGAICVSFPGEEEVSRSVERWGGLDVGGS